MKTTDIATLLLRTTSDVSVWRSSAEGPGGAKPTPVIVMSGTRTWRDLVFDDLNVRPVRWPVGRESGVVHGGFAKRTLRLRDAIRDDVSEHDDFALGGYSLGGACAILMASLLHSEGKRVRSVTTFGVPSLGTPSFQRVYRSQGLWERTVNFHTPRDPIVHSIPPVFCRVGQYTALECDPEADAMAQHDMETYADALMLWESQPRSR